MKKPMLKTLFRCALIGLFPLMARAAEPWQEITMPTVAEAAAVFPNPPREFAAIHWSIWGGQQSKERILADIENVNASGGGIYMINNSRGLQPPYLSPAYMELVKFAVDECKKRGMKVWIEGDGGYPDGFAGGLIRKDYPQLGMQGIVADARYTVAAGQTLSIPLPSDTLGIFANESGQGAAAAGQEGKSIPVPADGKLSWTAPSGSTWEVTVHAASGDGRYSVVAGQTLGITIPTGTTSIDATPGGGGRGGRGGAGRAAGQASTIIPVPADAQFKWTAPATGNWEVTFVRHVYRSSPTRYSDREDGTSDKDSLYTLIDYLNPEATATYLKLVHETYQKVVGDEFGKTILGFRGDETDYTGFIPWTPKLLETFQKEKGYDLQPYIAGFFATPLTDEERRVKADYWDVWSGMFRDNFYKPLEEWCRARNMDYMMHLNHEETMLSRAGGEGMISNEGSFWRDMRYMGVPGVDNLNQIGPGIVADFPKIAVSASHMFGRPLSWEEEGGSTGQTGKFIIDYQFVRGMNYMNIRGLNTAPAEGANKPLLDPASATGWYVTRSQHLLAVGRPAAQVAFYHPTDSYWLGDQEADTVNLKLVTELLEHQIDFDHVDNDFIASIGTLEDGGLKNLSGQVYRAVIYPTSTVIDKSVLDKLRAFAAGGGKVIFVGRTPSMVVDQNFLHPEAGPPDLSFATLEPTAEITDRVIAALPKPDVQLDSPCPPVKYIHRNLKDGDVYFFFNESDQPQSRTATIAGNGQAQVWDATTGLIHPLAGITSSNGSVAIPLNLEAWEARFIVVGPLPATVGQPWSTFSSNQTLVALDGNWSVTLGEKKLDTALKSWQELGVDAFNGIAEYHKTFTAPDALPKGQRLFIDLGSVHEVARVVINGTSFDARGWTPYVWDVTDAVKPGANEIEVDVQVPPAGGRGGAGGGRAAAGGAPGGAGGGAAGNGAAGAAGGGAGGGVPAGGAGAGAGRGAGRAGGGRGRGGGAAGGGAAGGGAAGAPAGRGLLGPVRLVSQ
jgi:hypothetical protein